MIPLPGDKFVNNLDWTVLVISLDLSEGRVQYRMDNDEYAYRMALRSFVNALQAWSPA